MGAAKSNIRATKGRPHSGALTSYHARKCLLKGPEVFGVPLVSSSPQESDVEAEVQAALAGVAKGGAPDARSAEANSVEAAAHFVEAVPAGAAAAPLGAAAAPAGVAAAPQDG